MKIVSNGKTLTVQTNQNEDVLTDISNLKEKVEDIESVQNEEILTDISNLREKVEDLNSTIENSSLIYYATCEDPSYITKKTIRVNGEFKLRDGVIVVVRFLESVAVNSTLNVANTGEINIYYQNSQIKDGIIYQGDTVTFIYSYYWHILAIDRIAGTTISGKLVTDSLTTTAVAGIGAEIFNDYRQRVYTNSGQADAGNIAVGNYTHAEGHRTSATGTQAHAEGVGTIASGGSSHAQGGYGIASGGYSHTGGLYCNANKGQSHAEGSYTIADGTNQFVIGKYNSSDTSSMFIIGSGKGDTSRSNCFRVTTSGVFTSGEYSSSGADYAELFEWVDGNVQNEDRRGLFVTLTGDKIRIATPDDDYILGVVSGAPSVVGDVYDDQWQGMYETDIFGTPIFEDVEVPEVVEEVIDPESGENTKIVIVEAYVESQQKLNPNYDSSKKYIPRTERPEWDAVGLMGKLVACDDGTCVPNLYCKVGENGKATISYERTPYRVMKRLDETHIKIMILPF